MNKKQRLDLALAENLLIALDQITETEDMGKDASTNIANMKKERDNFKKNVDNMKKETKEKKEKEIKEKGVKNG